MPVLFGVMRGSDDALREFLFQQLTALVSFLRQHTRKYLPDILGLVHDFWIPTSPLMPHILRLLSELSGAPLVLVLLSRLPPVCTHPSLTTLLCLILRPIVQTVRCAICSGLLNDCPSRPLHNCLPSLLLTSHTLRLQFELCRVRVTGVTVVKLVTGTNPVGGSDP